MGLREYIGKRAVDSIVLFIVTVIFNFILFRLMPGDPTLAILGTRGQFDPDFILELRAKYGLDKPVLPLIQSVNPLTFSSDLNSLLDNQFIIYLQHLIPIVNGQLFPDLGTSTLFYPRSVGDIIFSYRLLNTIILMGASIFISFIIAIIIGTLAASKFRSKTDITSIIINLTSYSTPVFWVGMLIIVIFFRELGWIPLSGAPRMEEYNTLDINLIIFVIPIPIEWALDYFHHMLGPLITLTISFVGGWFLLARDQMLGIFTEDYMMTARAKGLPTRRVLFTHARKNAMLPMISVLAVAMTYLVSGATLTETVFVWDGIGLLTINAVVNADYPLLQGLFMIVAAVAIMANFVADVIYAFLDPRIRY
ncbi:MAG: ABC transporter permease [Promethearchaeota archaeon]